MPRTIVLPDPDATATVGTSINIVRSTVGAAGVHITYDVPGDPGGPFTITAAQLSAGARTNLQAIHAEIIALFRASRGYV